MDRHASTQSEKEDGSGRRRQQLNEHSNCRQIMRDLSEAESSVAHASVLFSLCGRNGGSLSELGAISSVRDRSVCGSICGQRESTRGAFGRRCGADHEWDLSGPATASEEAFRILWS